MVKADLALQLASPAFSAIYLNTNPAHSPMSGQDTTTSLKLFYLLNCHVIGVDTCFQAWPAVVTLGQEFY